jgi:predicted dehydrogenase
VGRIKKLKVGIVGTGGMAKVHTSCFQQNKNCEVIAVCSRNKNRLKKFCKGEWEDVVYANEKLGEFPSLYKIKKGYTNFKKMVEDKEINIISICTPPSLHYEQVVLSLSKGKNVLVEKPFSLSFNEALRMAELSQKYKKKLMVAQTWRFHPEAVYVRSLIKKGRLGKIFKIKSYAIHKDWAPDGWFRNKKLAGGGSLMDMGVHSLDIIKFLLLERRVEKVFAKTGTYYGTYSVDDSSDLILILEGDILGFVESGWNYPYSEGGEAHTLIYGTKGFARIFPLKVMERKNKKWKDVTPKNFKKVKVEEVYQNQINCFVDCVLKNKEVPVPLKTSVENARIIESAYKKFK